MRIYRTPFLRFLEAAGLQEVQLVRETERFELWKVTSRTQFGASDKWVLHLSARSPLESADEVQRAKTELKISQKDLFAVTDEGFKYLPERVQEEFRVAATFSRRRFLANALHFTHDAAPADTAADRTFVDPQIVLSSPDRSVDALQYLERWLRGDEDTTSSVAVLFADAGIGKTTVVSRLARRLAISPADPDRVQIPLLVEARHWLRLATGIDLELWDIWRESAGPIGVGAKTQFEVCVAEGMIMPIFDGFDELCQWRGATFAPEETLERLFDLVALGGRLLLTTREGYWNDSLSDEARTRCLQARLRRFDKPRRDQYFEHRFRTDFEARKRAKTLQQELDAQLYAGTAAKYPDPDMRITAIPAILSFIATSAETAVTTTPPSVPIGPDLESLLARLCDRESVRQGMTATAKTQLDLFSLLAIDPHETFSESDIETYASTFPELRKQARLLFAPHPFIESVGAGGGRRAYAFRFDFLRAALAARWLDLNLDSQAEITEVMRILEQSARGGSSVLEYLSQRLEGSADVSLGRLGHVWAYEKVSKKAKSALWHLALALHVSLSRAERADLVLRLFGDRRARTFTGLFLTGHHGSIDFSAIRFVNCEFADCVMAKCVFNEQTVFESCTFSGQFQFVSCKGDDKLQLASPIFETPEPREAFASRTSDSRRGVLDGGLLRRTFRYALSKFARGRGFSSIEYDLRNRGLLAQSPVRDDVWESLSKHNVVYRHTISGLGPDKGMSVDSEAMTAVRQFLDNGDLSGGVREAFAQVAADWSVSLNGLG